MAAAAERARGAALCAAAALLLWAAAAAAPAAAAQQHALRGGGGWFPDNSSAFTAGYVTVNGSAAHGAHLFYWHFEARHAPAEAPLVVWLTGGPGCSSVLALLSENGPALFVPGATDADAGGEPTVNPYSWTETANVVWVDQPVGTGFSYAESPFDYVRNEQQVADDMFTFLREFVRTYPQYATRPLFVTGESYAGHYVPAIAQRVLEGNARGESALNLRGIAIGNGWVDPLVQYGQYARFAFDNQLVSEGTYRRLNESYAVCAALLRSGLWPLALEACQGMVEDILLHAGGINVYDIRRKCTDPPLCYNFDAVGAYLNSAPVQRGLGVDRHWVSCNMVVHTLLLGDWMHNLELAMPAILASGIEVLVYSGTDDFICNYYGGDAWTQAVAWPHQDDFRNAPLVDWLVDGAKAGRARRAANLTFLEVFGAGHMVPMDQPRNALEMLRSFVAGKPLVEHQH